MLAEIIVNQQRMAAGVAEILAHRAPRIGRDKLQRRGFRSGRGDDGRVFHRAVTTQLLDHLRDRRALLADRHVDTLHVLAALIDYRIDRERGLAGLTITDNQLALPATDLDHRVDSLDSGLQRLLDRLPLDDPRGLDLDPALFTP